MEKQENTEGKTLIVALYKFVSLEDYVELRPRLESRCQEWGIRGTLLLAKEGINGTIAGSESSIRSFLDYLRTDPRLVNLAHKESWAEAMPFLRLKVRLKKEIVTLGVEGVDPTKVVGTYVKPQDWNAIISDPDVVLVDTRNDYEVEIGTFQGAIDPKTDSFTEFPQWSREAPELKGRKKVAMFCTGGIRCEKASSFLLEEGVEEVFHLEGGILRYLEEVPPEESMWEGECFVFDGRVAVDHHLQPGKHIMCFGCRRPVSPEAMKSPKYMEGVCCPYCHDDLTPEQRARFQERHLQIQLASERNEAHLGRVIPAPDKPSLAERELPVLYSFRRCPYAIRARLALVASGLEVELREVVLRDKPEHMLALSPKGTVPVLWLQSDEVIEESIQIMDWALAHSRTEAWAAPTQEERARLERLIEWNDGDFKGHLDRYKYPDRYPGAVSVEHRTEAESFLAELETRLTECPYLHGEAFGRTDAAILPFIRQFANTDRAWFDEAPYPRVQEWLAAGLESSLFTRVMKKFRRWEESSLGGVFPVREEGPEPK